LKAFLLSAGVCRARRGHATLGLLAAAGTALALVVPAGAGADPGRGNQGTFIPPGQSRGAPRQGVTSGVFTPTLCTLTLTSSINGGLVVPMNQRYCLLGAHIHGSMAVQPGAEVILEGATIDGGFTSSGATEVRICASRVNGPTTVQNGGGTVLIGADVDDGSTYCPADVLHGPLTIGWNEAGIEVEGGWITGPVTVTNNSGPAFRGSDAGAEIEASHITGPLMCTGNTPAPTNDGLKDTVTGPETGQCAGF
jgi:hexosaminidase